MREVGITAERGQAAVRMAATVNAAAAKAPKPVMLAESLARPVLARHMIPPVPRE